VQSRGLFRLWPPRRIFKLCVLRLTDLVLGVRRPGEAISEKHPANCETARAQSIEAGYAFQLFLPSRPASCAISFVHVTVISSPLSARLPLTVQLSPEKLPWIEWPRRRTSCTISSALNVALPSMMWICGARSCRRCRARAGCDAGEDRGFFAAQPNRDELGVRDVLQLLRRQNVRLDGLADDEIVTGHASSFGK
jgi:hypothetical protein